MPESSAPVTYTIFPQASPIYLPRSPGPPLDSIFSLGPSQIPPLSLIPHRIKATSPPTYLQPHFLLTFSLTSMLTSKLTSNKISMLTSKLTSSQSLLIRLRRKITSPTLKFSSCLLFPVKSNRAWEKNMVRKEGRNIHQVPTAVLTYSSVPFNR